MEQGYEFRELNLKSKDDIVIFLEFILEIVQDYERSDTVKNALKYIEKDWLCYGIIRSDFEKMIGFCVIKNPTTHPETTTIIQPMSRNQGWAAQIRNFAIESAYTQNKIGDFKVIYSSTDKDNIASLKSILNSGFSVVSISDDKQTIFFEKRLA